MSAEFYTQFNGIAIIIAFFMLCLMIILPLAGRVVLSLLLFITACITWVQVTQHPGIYHQYNDFVLFPWYGHYIVQPFIAHLPAAGIIIAVVQLFVSVGLLLKNTVFNMACVLALLFLVIIAPLGLAAFFPATLLPAAGCIVLLRKKICYSVWERPVK